MNIRVLWATAACTLAAAQAAGQSAVDEVVVTATPLRQSPLETAQPASVLQGEALQREVALSLGETLQKQLGVTGTYFGPAASRPVIRGLGGERVQVLEDSIGSLDVSALSEDHAVTVEPILADRVEIIKGPATLLYGNAAVGGVVNVLTNRVPTSIPDEPVSGAVELRGDSAASERSAAGHIDVSAGRIALHADLYDRSTDDVEIPGFALSDRVRAELLEEGEPFADANGTLPSSDLESSGGTLGASYVGGRGFLGTSYNRYVSEYGVPGAETQPDGSGVRIDMSQDRYDLSGELREIGGRVENVRLRASRVEYSHQEFEPDGTPGTRFVQDADELRVAADHAELAGWRGIFGVQLRDVDFIAVGEEAFVPASRTTSSGLFLFEERAFGDWKLELGARFERQEIDVDEAAVGAADFEDDGISLSAGLLWKLAGDYRASLNVTRTQRQPSATELFANGPHIAASRFEIGDPALDTEVAGTVDVTLRRIGERVRFELTAFASQYDDYIFPLPTGESAGDEEPLPVVQYVQQDADFYGFEGEVVFALSRQEASPLQLRLASDYVRGELSGDGGNLPQVPPLRFGAELIWERARWTAGLSVFRYAEQDEVSAAELPTDSYTMVDLDLGYELPTAAGPVLVFVKAANLGDEEARRHTSPLKEFAPLPGRSLRAGVRLRF